MRTEVEIQASARDVPPFSNGTEYFEWWGNWCADCMSPPEKAWRDYENGKRKHPLKDYPGGCPLIGVAIAFNKTPTEWMEQEGKPWGDQYHCIEHRGPDDGGGDGEPKPQPEPPNMDGLFERPERAVRMLRPYETRELAVQS